MKIEKISLETYLDYLQKNNLNYCALQGSGGYQKLKESGCNPVIYAGCSEKDEIKIVMLCGEVHYMKVFKELYSPYGYLSTEPYNIDLVVDFFKSIADSLKHTSVVSMRFDTQLNAQDHDDFKKDLIKAGFLTHGYSEEMFKNNQPMRVAVLDLKGKTKADWLSSCSSTMRNQIKRSKVDYLCIEESNPDVLYELLTKSGDYQHFQPVSKGQVNSIYKAYKESNSVKIKTVYLLSDVYYSYTQEKIEKLESDLDKLSKKPSKKKSREDELNIQLHKQMKNLDEAERLLAMGMKKIPVASSMFTYTPTQVSYLWSGIDRNYAHFNGSMMLIESVVDECLEQGIPEFNLLGINGSCEPSDTKNYPLVQFKKSLGAEIVTYLGVFRYPVNKFWTKIIFNKTPD